MEWISVEDRIPNNFITVLVYTAWDDIDTGYIWGNDWTLPEKRNVEVTHWMPLPEPPKE